MQRKRRAKRLTAKVSKMIAGAIVKADDDSVNVTVRAIRKVVAWSCALNQCDDIVAGISCKSLQLIQLEVD